MGLLPFPLLAGWPLGRIQVPAPLPARENHWLNQVVTEPLGSLFTYQRNGNNKIHPQLHKA